MTIKLVTNQKIAETSSKGNQEKWFDEENNRWYKLDLFGYEALAETVVSALVKKSNIKELEFQITEYQMEKLEVRKHLRTGCSSENFLLPGEELITVAHLLKKGIGVNYLKELEKKKTLQKKISYLVDSVKELTGLDRFGSYLTLLFEVDMLFLNDDRHLNNIAIIKKDDTFRYCPLFDFGAALLSNIREYPLDIAPSGLIRNITAKPFNCSFTRQVHAAQALYGNQLYINYTDADIDNTLTEINHYYAQIYVAEFRDRIKTCLGIQQKKYTSLQSK